MVHLACPYCRTSFEADTALTVGAQVPCPTCGRGVAYASDSATVMLGGAPSQDDYVPFSDTKALPTRIVPSRPGSSDVIDLEAPTGGPAQAPRPSAPPPAPRGPAPAPSDSATVALPGQPDYESKTVALDPGEARTLPSNQAAPLPSGQSRQLPSAPPPPPAMQSGSGPGGGGEDLTGRRLGGYLLKKKLGAGGMGAVYLARQLSLDRDVAFKVLPAKLASDPDFVARFTREALSAAHLNHHNVIQVFDVGSEQNIHYISMEFVNGSDLGAMIRRDGKLAVEDAAGYMLQAARGLYYSHSNSIIHRDIKPDNLMVNEHGVVKIADMGLAKKMGSVERAVGLDAGAEGEMRIQLADSLTGANVAMGTPAYMAPEQGRDASKVDHRADQYSLGCTLYYLCAGKTPFTGKTTFEIISKHASEPLVPLDHHVRNVPKELSYIIEKMLAKNPADRYPSMKEVIEALEAYLGVESSKGPYTPREHHVAVLEREQKDFYAAKSRKLVLGARAGFVMFCLVLLGTSLASQSYWMAASALGLLVLTPIFSFIINGVVRKDYVFRRVRSIFFGMSLSQWAKTIAGTIGVLAVLWLSNLLLPWLTVSLIALGFAALQQFVIMGKLRKERAPALQNMQDMLKQLRLRGVSEEAIQDFICRFSGEHWEEFFESLFGYEDMVLQRAKWTAREKLKPRKRFATWRDPLVRYAEELEQARRKAREERQLVKAEKSRLKAKGMDEATAQAEANKLAQSAVAEGTLARTVVVSFDRETRDAMDKAALDLIKSGRKKGKIFWGFRLVRLAVALVLVTCGAAQLAGGFYPPIVVNIVSWLRDATGGEIIKIPVLIVGAVLLLSVFSSRIVLPAVALVLGLALFIPGVVAANSGVLAASQVVQLVTLLAVATGIGLVAGKVMKGKF